MKRAQVALELRDELHAAEAALEVALTTAESTLDRMRRARQELGLAGTVGDAAMARVKDTITALEEARAELIAGHQEVYGLYEALDFRRDIKMEVTYPSGFSAVDEPRRA